MVYLLSIVFGKKHRTERKPDGSVKYDYVDEYEEGDDLIINFKKFKKISAISCNCRKIKV